VHAERKSACMRKGMISVHAERDQRACGRGSACMRKGFSVHAERDHRAC
jgi:hypothetical protein